MQPSSPADPQLVLGGIMRGAATLQAVAVAVRLRLPDVLAAGPRTPAELAAETGAAPAPLARLLRALATVGCFEARPEGAYALTPLSDVLREDHPRSARARLLAAAAPFAVEAWLRLEHSVRTGESAFVAAHGVSKWEYYAAHPADAATFDQAMLGRTQARIAPVLAAYDFAPFAHVVDVGGGRGHLLAGILARHANARGTLLDAPSVVPGSAPVLAAAGVTDRVAVVPGDFRQEVPRGGDLYVLSDILHDWGDDECQRILEKCAAAMEPNAKLLVVELLMPESHASPLVAWLDLLMLVEFGGGRQRTESELRTLFERSGLVLERVVPAGEVSVVEGRRC